VRVGTVRNVSARNRNSSGTYSSADLWSRNRSIHAHERSESAARTLSEMPETDAAAIMMVQRKGNVGLFFVCLMGFNWTPKIPMSAEGKKDG